MQGASLVPLLKGETPADWRKSFYYHYYEYPGPAPRPPALRRRHRPLQAGPLLRPEARRQGRPDYWELYDREKDPNEMKSFYADPAYADTVKELKTELDKLRKELKVPDEMPKEAFGNLLMPPKKIRCEHPFFPAAPHQSGRGIVPVWKKSLPSGGTAAMIRTGLLSVVALLVVAPLRAANAPAKPNIIFILSDDLAQGDVGCYGQKLIKTPHLDAMADEGTRFTQAYCGTSVCAPSRTSLMIGLHMGHSPIRANREIQPEGQKPLPAGTYTVAKLLKDDGYATACVGKWGMGMFDTTGSPLKIGFDHFFGYNCQRHAHSYFPTYLYNDDKRFDLAGNDGKGVGKTYAQNLIADETLAWVTANKDKPFFLFYAITLPHGRLEIDDQGIYKNEKWTEQQKNYAAMVTRLDPTSAGCSPCSRS